MQYPPITAHNDTERISPLFTLFLCLCVGWLFISTLTQFSSSAAAEATPPSLAEIFE